MKRKIIAIIVMAALIVSAGGSMSVWDVLTECSDVAVKETESAGTASEDTEVYDAETSDSTELCAAADETSVPTDVDETGDADEADGNPVTDMAVEADSPADVIGAYSDNNMVDAAELVRRAEASGASGDSIMENQYQLKRVILFAEDVTDTYGASDIIHYDEYDHYVFSFDTEEETEAAYCEMVADYGESCCILDEIVASDDMLASEYTGEADDCIGWGAVYMGMNYLKAETEYYDVTGTVNVAVVDSGLNDDFEVFDGRINEEDSYNFYEDTSDYSDDMGHGTHVTGIIADSTPDNVQITVLKCFSDGYSTNSAIIAAVESAITDGTDVVNMSICWYGRLAAYMDFLDNLITKAKQKDVAICVAAGNAHDASGIQNVANSSYPANRKDVIVVSALQKTGSGSKVISDTSVEFDESYSYYGSTVDFSAPGTDVKSTWYDGSYTESSGTSMAAPYITAAVAYVKMLQPLASNDRVCAILRSYCVDLGTEGKDIYYGYGCPYIKNLFGDYFDEEHIADCALTSAANVKSGIKLSWNKVKGADGYRIYRKKTTGGYTCIKTVSSGSTVSYVDTAVFSGKKYRYKIVAVRDGQTGAAANSKATVRLSEPKVAVKNGSKGVVVSWSRTASATGYTVYRKAAGQTLWTEYRTVGKNYTSMVDSNVKGGKIYSYTVAAKYGSSVKSTYSTTGKKIYRMSTRKLTSLTAKSGGKVIAKWKTSSGVTGYQLQYSTNKKFKTYELVTVKGKKVSAKKISGLTKGRYCYVRVRSYKKVGGVTYYSGWSACKKIKVK